MKSSESLKRPAKLNKKKIIPTGPHYGSTMNPMFDNNNIENRGVTEPQSASNPLHQSLVIVIWLTLQLVVSAVMTTLSAFHQFVPGSTPPCTANASDVNGTITSCSSWGFSIVSMTFTALLLIFSVVDATINMHYLVHQVLDNKETEEKNDCKQHEKKTIEAIESSCCSKLVKLCSHFPMGAVRVFYCWIMLAIISITVAANTYEWSWQTDHLKALSNTGLFYFTWVSIILLIIGSLVWHCNFYMETKKSKVYLRVFNRSTLLIFLNTVFVIVVVITCRSLEANFGLQIRIRIPLAILLLICVFSCTTIWLAAVRRKNNNPCRDNPVIQ